MKKWSVVFLLLVSCVPLTQTSTTNSGTPKILTLSDASYEPQIKTVRVYPEGTSSDVQLLPTVTKLGNWNLVLEFDDLQESRDSYYARVIHCNQDWTKSTLSDLDFMPQFNEFPLLNFEFSLDTQIPYVHYKFRLPAVKLPGNYVLAVYRGSDKTDLILTKRFMVYDSRVSFSRDGNLLGAGAATNVNQQLNFTINYKNLDLINPMENVNVTIRQNQRWDNLAEGLKPAFVRDNIRELEYRVFDPAKMLKGGNEFRWFDLRSLNYPGRNVQSVDKTQKPFHVFIQEDVSRKGQPYAIFNDLNGNYQSDNYDFRNPVSANYAYVHFALRSSQPVDGAVYLNGAFTNWSTLPDYLMTYDAIKQQYTATVLLRQGYYDYQYVVKSATVPYDYFEGNHFETENEYEILVYYRSFQPQADLLIGYIELAQNPR
ncbi:MAG: DUF5103 domain-containing protein [Cyclobacteriaceae bacterium]|nr:DUF5103 domain-containing protein [Cyclobacteriaceae bacterium]